MQAAGAGVLLSAALWLRPGAVMHGPTTCPFLLLTGLPCPTCGMTRAWTLIGHGRFTEAMTFNPLTPLVMALAALWCVAAGVAWARGESPPRWLRRVAFPVAAIIVGVYGVIRIVLVATGRWQWVG
ncbi:DUF2752 domain-containing protein [Calidifontibacter terrae]